MSDSITIERLQEVAKEFKRRFPYAGMNSLLVSERGKEEVQRMLAHATHLPRMTIIRYLGIRIEARSWFPDDESGMVADSCLELLDGIAKDLGPDAAAKAWSVLADLSKESGE